MDKISTQKFNVTVKNSEISKADDVLGALFSMPMIADENKVNEKIIDEFIVNPSIEKVLNSKKSSKSLVPPFFTWLIFNRLSIFKSKLKTFGIFVELKSKPWQFLNINL